MLRLEKLSVQPLQPLPLLQGLAPRLVTLAETAGASDEHLLGTTHSLLQLQLTQMGSAIRELDGVDSADDLQQKRMRIQKAIQELLPSLSSAVQQLPAGRVRAALFLALGSSLVLIKSSRLLFANPQGFLRFLQGAGPVLLAQLALLQLPQGGLLRITSNSPASTL